MKTVAAVAFLFLLMPLQAKAQSVELTLVCQYETSLDVRKSLAQEISGSLSAIVHLQSLSDGRQAATIQATTVYCFNFEGSFNDLVVNAECKRILDNSTKVEASLQINRISGEFDQTLKLENSSRLEFNSSSLISGHCKPAKKLF
jgi:hypothetical protein